MPRKTVTAPTPSTRTMRSKAAADDAGPSNGAQTKSTGEKRALDTGTDDVADVKEPPLKKTRGTKKKPDVDVRDDAKVDEEMKDGLDAAVNGDVPKADAQNAVKDGGEDTGNAAPQKEKAKRGKAKAKGKTKAAAEPEDAGDAAEDSQDVPDKDPADVEPEKEAKMITVLKRGAAPVDPHSNFVNTHQVYVDSTGEVYDAMLMQTNIGVNANKFYNLQLVHPVAVPSMIALHTRWGRVGERGQSQDKGPFVPQQAPSEFKKQFRSKTGFAWEDRKTAKAKTGKYDFVEREFEAEEEPKNESGPSKKESKAPAKIPPSTLSPELKALMTLIFNTSYMSATLSSFSYDQNKAPLGKMSKATLLRGFAELKKISELIQNPSSLDLDAHGSLQSAYITYSQQYYTFIPHAFGRNPPTIIDNDSLLKRELDLIDALGDMEVAAELLAESSQSGDGTPVHPLDAQLASLDLKSIEPLDKTSTEFRHLVQYATDTHGTTHHFGAEILEIFRVERKGEKEAWEKAGWHKLPDGDKLLLWHGSRVTNFAGILKQGLRIAPPEAPVSGYMFGKGVYFADMMSKSAGYCYPQISDRTGLLLLCEVAAKPFYETPHADFNAGDKCKSANSLATKGLGRTAPVEWADAGKHLGNGELSGTMMPNGPGQPITLQTASLMYNEYIVYEPHQIRLRYLLRWKMG